MVEEQTYVNTTMDADGLVYVPIEEKDVQSYTFMFFSHGAWRKAGDSVQLIRAEGGNAFIWYPKVDGVGAFRKETVKLEVTVIPNAERRVIYTSELEVDNRNEICPDLLEGVEELWTLRSDVDEFVVRPLLLKMQKLEQEIDAVRPSIANWEARHVRERLAQEHRRVKRTLAAVLRVLSPAS